MYDEGAKLKKLEIGHTSQTKTKTPSHALGDFRVIDRFLYWGNHGNPKSAKDQRYLKPRHPGFLLTEGEKSSGNPETGCHLTGFCEEQSKASLIGAFMLGRGVRRHHKVQIVNLHRDSLSFGSIQGCGGNNVPK